MQNSIRVRIVESNLFTKLAFAIFSVILIGATVQLTYSFSFNLTREFALAVFNGSIVAATAFAIIIQVGALVFWSTATLYREAKYVFIVLCIAAGAINVVDWFTNISSVYAMPWPTDPSTAWAVVIARYVIATVLVAGEEIVMALTTALIFALTLILSHFNVALPAFLRMDINDGSNNSRNRPGSRPVDRHNQSGQRKKGKGKKRRPNGVPPSPHRSRIDERADSELAALISEINNDFRPRND